jgi:hypothetical protein
MLATSWQNFNSLLTSFIEVSKRFNLKMNAHYSAVLAFKGHSKLNNAHNLLGIIK